MISRSEIDMSVEDVARLADLFRSQPSYISQAGLLCGLIHGVMGDWSREEKLRIIGILAKLWDLDSLEYERLH